MKNEKDELRSLVIRDLKSEDPIPYELLLQADPSQKRIDSYIKKSRSRITQLCSETIGICVLMQMTLDNEQNCKSHDSDDVQNIECTDRIAEIMNLSIAEKFQGRGYGRALVLDAIRIARSSKMKKLHVGTGNSSITQIGFYQKCGFRITSVETDFFTKNYTDEIVENGIVCRDLIRMTMIL
jgi:ribosomal protein S18 acetylase RimI-like enzyme